MEKLLMASAADESWTVTVYGFKRYNSIIKRFAMTGHMASADGCNEPEWIERVRSEGAVPLLEPDNCPNGWACPPGDNFMVRGPEYYSTKVKIPGGKYLLKSLGFDWIKTSTKLGEVLSHHNNRVRKAVDDAFPIGDKPFIWAFNLQLPTKDNYSAVAYFVATEPIQRNVFEVAIDIGSSMVASAIVHLAFGYITTLTVDLAFLIESQNESELPEQLLGAVRFSELNPDSARLIEPSSGGSNGNLQASLPTRLWKSLGQVFSQLLHPGAQESDSVSTSTHVNGTADHDENDGDLKKW
ncbi:hypothetical protein CRYUN_Cryun36dG0017500 [Craigia yunnanensis]